MAGGQGKLHGRGYWRKDKGFAVERRVIGLRGQPDAKFWTGWFPTELQAAHAADLTSWYLYRHHHQRMKNNHINFPSSYANLQAALHPKLRPLQSLHFLLLPLHKSLFFLSCLLYVAKVAPHSRDSARLKEFMDKHKDLINLHPPDNITLQKLSDNESVSAIAQSLVKLPSHHHHHHNVKTSKMVEKKRNKTHNNLAYEADKGESGGKQAREGEESAWIAQGLVKRPVDDHHSDVNTKASKVTKKKRKRTYNNVANEADHKGESGDKEAREGEERKFNIEKEVTLESLVELNKKKRRREVRIEDDKGKKLKVIEGQFVKEKGTNCKGKVGKHEKTHTINQRRSPRFINGHQHPQQCNNSNSTPPKEKKVKASRKWIVLSSPSSDKDEVFPNKRHHTFHASNAKAKLPQGILPQNKECNIINNKNEKPLKQGVFNKASTLRKRGSKTRLFRYSSTPSISPRMRSRAKIGTSLSTTSTQSNEQQVYSHSTTKATQKHGMGTSLSTTSTKSKEQQTYSYSTTKTTHKHAIQGEGVVDEVIIGAHVPRKVRTSISKKLNDLNFFFNNLSQDNLTFDTLDLDNLLKEVDLLETINVDVKTDDLSNQYYFSTHFGEVFHTQDYDEEVDDWLDPLKDSLQDIPFLNIDDCPWNFELF